MNTIECNADFLRRERSLSLPFVSAHGRRPLLAFLFLLLAAIAVSAQQTTPTAHRAWKVNLEQGLGTYAGGYSARAAQVLETATKKHGEFPELVYWLGFVRYRPPQWDQALNSSKQSCEIEYSNAEGPPSIASTYQQQEKPILAIIRYERALNIGRASSKTHAGLKREKLEAIDQNQEPQFLSNSGFAPPDSRKAGEGSTSDQAPKAPTDWARILKVGYARALKREHSSPMFFVGDFVELGLFAHSITRADTEFKRFLWHQFSPEVQNKLLRYATFRTNSRGLEESLVKELNRVIQTGAFYSKERFKGASLSYSTRRLASTSPEGVELFRLNRMLVSDVFADALSPSRPRLIVLGIIWVGACLFLAACFTTFSIWKFGPPANQSRSVALAAADSCIGASSSVAMWGITDLVSLTMIGIGGAVGLLVAGTAKEMRHTHVGAIGLSLFTIMRVIGNCISVGLQLFILWVAFAPSFIVALLVAALTGWNGQYIFCVVGIIEALILMASVEFPQGKKIPCFLGDYLDGNLWVILLMILSYPWFAILAYLLEQPLIGIRS